MYSAKTVILSALVAILTAKLGNPLLDELVLRQKAITREASFDPNTTDVLGYKGMEFLRPELEMQEVNVTPVFALAQILQKLAPTWLKHLQQQYITSLSKIYADFQNDIPINILDARNDTNLTFQTTGFTLLNMERPSETQDFRSQTDTKKFIKELEPKILELYPGASRIEFFEKATNPWWRQFSRPAYFCEWMSSGFLSKCHRTSDIQPRAPEQPKVPSSSCLVRRP